MDYSTDFCYPFAKKTEGSKGMKKLIVLLAVIAGCATVQPPQEGMRSTRGISVSIGDSLQSFFKSFINEAGLECSKVDDFGDATLAPKPNSMVVKAQCPEGTYIVTVTWDFEWFKVVQAKEPISKSLERPYQEAIYGNGFKCSDVTDFYEIKKGTLYKVDCLEGSYKVTKDGARFEDIKPW